MPTQLKPILEESQVRTYKGRYNIQLEIPAGSTLSESDISFVEKLASWDIDPNEAAEGYEGGRAVLISREHSRVKQKISLTALQLSGIGYKKIKKHGKVDMISKDGVFYPPSSDNFMQTLSGTKMSTSFSRNGRLSSSQPTYRALGTYTASELETTIRNTMIASLFKLDDLVTPDIEAYGRYLQPELQNQEGNFGFVVFSIPSIREKRMTELIFDAYTKLAADTVVLKHAESAVMAVYSLVSACGMHIARGLHDMHEKERYVHLQAHLSNAYLVKGVVYLMDWQTMTRLGDNKEDNIINRALDIIKPLDNFIVLYETLLGKSLSQSVKDMAIKTVHELMVQAYSGRTKTKDDDNRIIRELFHARNRIPNGEEESYLNMTRQWIKDRGYEGFPVSNPQSPFENQAFFNELGIKPNEKIKRNDRCPCGSGKKYKNCCLKK